MLILTTVPEEKNSIAGYDVVISFNCPVCGQDQRGWPEHIYGTDDRFTARCRPCGAVLPKVGPLSNKRTVRLQYHIDTIIRENSAY